MCLNDMVFEVFWLVLLIFRKVGSVKFSPEKPLLFSNNFFLLFLET